MGGELKLIYKIKRPVYMNNKYTVFDLYHEADILRDGKKAVPIAELRMNHLMALKEAFKGRKGPLAHVDRKKKDKKGKYLTVPFPGREHFLPDTITIAMHEDIRELLPKGKYRVRREGVLPKIGYVKGGSGERYEDQQPSEKDEDDAEEKKGSIFQRKARQLISRNKKGGQNGKK